MMNWKSLIISIMLFTDLSIRSAAQGFLKADGQKIVNGKGENVLLRGVGLGGWMVQEGYMFHLNKDGQQFKIKQRIHDLLGQEQTQVFYDAWLSNQTTRSDIDSLHAWGFNSVRLPMHYNLLTLPVDEEPVAGKNTWLTRGFILTDSLVSWCKANHMYVFLDLHAAPGGQGNDVNISDRDSSKPSLWQSKQNWEKTIALWQKIAKRYANEPTVGGYDILNEPNWGFEDTLNDRNGLKEKKNIQLKQLLTDITLAIRKVDKNHIIIIEGNGWGNNYNGLLGPWDGNMVLSFHKYWNYNDQQSIQHIINFRAQYNVPVWLGETGENSNTWFTEAIRLFEKNNIGWSWWPLKKLGNNNPLQIKSNPGYDSLVDYWNGKSFHPPSTVYSSLMQLARDAKCENNIVHHDVIDAMIRQPFVNQAIPYLENNISNGTVIFAVNYDLGPNGFAYYDLDTANYRISAGKESVGNRGSAYRNDGVDIYEDSTEKGTYYVGHTEDGEWLQFTVNILESGDYTMELSLAAIQPDGIFSILDNMNPLVKMNPVPATGGYENWKVITVRHLKLNSGVHHLRILVDKGGFNIESIKFQKD
jgi:endoglucanase